MKPKVSIRIICQIAVLIAIGVVLERFCAIQPSENIRISLSFIPLAFVGMLYGPIWGGAAYGLADLIGTFLLSPWPFSLGIFFSRVVSGVIFGLFLHREDSKFIPHIIAASLTEQIVCACGLTTLARALDSIFPLGLISMSATEIKLLLAQLPTAYYLLLITRLFPIGITVAAQLITLPFLVRLRTTFRKTGVVTP